MNINRLKAPQTGAMCTRMDRTHSLTLTLHQHSYNHCAKRQLSYYRIWYQILLKNPPRHWDPGLSKIASFL